MNRPYTYDHIPQLKELMPTTGGVPGVTYLQCTVENRRIAQDDGFFNDTATTEIYTIVGPNGTADMDLLCRGKPIPGGCTKSGARKCMVDARVEELTGLYVNGPPPEEKSEPEKAPEKEDDLTRSDNPA
jgi:hypothetical protein